MVLSTFSHASMDILNFHLYVVIPTRKGGDKQWQKASTTYFETYFGVIDA